MGTFVIQKRHLRPGVSRELRREVSRKKTWIQKRKCECLEDKLHIFVLLIAQGVRGLLAILTRHLGSVLERQHCEATTEQDAISL